jgi:signal transduction histidine kinase
MCGYSEAELLKMSVGDLDASESAERVMAHIKKVIAKGADRFETQHRRKDGSVFFVEVSVQYRATENQKQCVAFLRDITERKKAEEEKEQLSAQLLHAQKMESVGRLAGGVAHDFNNMLGVILGHADLALRKVLPEHPMHDNLNEIFNAAKRSSDLTRQLLAFARKQAIAPKALDLNETISGMIKMLERMIGEQIILSWRPGRDTWRIKMDPSQIDQILANLCVNARDAISDVGRITIETENRTVQKEFCKSHEGAVPGEYVRLAVSDSGRGMDEDVLSHIFEPFFTTKEVGSGTGLGLATVYGAVKQNHGFIDVSSYVGLGSTIAIYFPRCSEKPVKSVEEAAVSRLDGPKTVLVVEDEPAILQLATMILQNHGHTVLAASAPGEAIRLAAKYGKDIHLLVTDVIMPEMNGRRLAKMLLSRHPHMRCLYMSGYTADVIEHDNLMQEGVCFIQKPFILKDFINKVAETLACNLVHAH